ncbi:MAG: glycosyltransferase family 4 protein [Planctomycetes bacterium]|nr:glycosyltransferase family 4 protein [Planctomycetota bacterium]
MSATWLTGAGPDAMHIAIVRTEFNRARGGAERYAVALARIWLEQGHRITVVCAKHEPADAQGMEVVTVSRPGILGPFKHRWFASRAGDAAKSVGAEAVLCLARAYPGHVMRLGDGLHRAWLGARYPDLGQRRRALLNPRHRELLKLERQMFLPGRFQLYVANSAMIRRAVVHMYGVDPDRVVVIPNGVDARRFSLECRARRVVTRASQGISPAAPLVLFSGMDFRRKGLPEAVRGFVALARSRPDAVFACVGPGDTAEARALLRQAGLEGSARFVDHTDAVGDWYAAADVFVLPTMHDPSANAVTECLACGTPVITSTENGARQHLRNGVNGWLLASRGNAAELAQRAALLLANAPRPEVVAQSGALISTHENARLVLETLVRAAAMQRALSPDAIEPPVLDEPLPQGAALESARWLGRLHAAGWRGLSFELAGRMRWHFSRRGGGPGDALLELAGPFVAAAVHREGFSRTRLLRWLRAYLWALQDSRRNLHEAARQLSGE